MITRMLKWVALSMAALTLSPAAMAQATRTWVSGVGDDVNPCSRTAPCKTFAGAISKTAVNGIINVIDSAGFGGVTINKNITIDGDGAYAGVLVSGTNAIVVNGPNVVVTLRNLNIEGVDTGLVGVSYIQGARLLIENCRIFGFRAGNAMGVRAIVGGQVVIRNSQFYDNNIGVHLESTNGIPLVTTLDNIAIMDTSQYAVQTAGMGPVYLGMKRSTISNNGGHGVHAAGPQAYITLTDNTFQFNGGTAVNAAFGGAVIRLSGNTIVDNSGTIGIAAGTTVASDGSNRIAGAGGAPNAVFTNQ